jgi:GNAT superfamily N-acetyltransferase
MDELIVREVELEDFDGLVPLFQQLQPKKELNIDNVKAFFQEIIKSDSHFAWVAVLDDKIVGYIDVVFRAYHFAFEFVARIETTIVDESQRRKGIATKLIQACEEKAKVEGCKVIELDSAMHRESAHEFYEKCGYEKRGYLFWKKI